MNSKDLQKIVVDEIYEGKSHQEIYDGLNAKFPNREIDLARIVAKEVTLAQRQRYGIWNTVLIVLLAISVAIKVAVAVYWVSETGPWTLILSLFLPVINVVMLVGVVKWRLGAYSAVGTLGVMSLFKLQNFTLSFAFNPFNGLSTGLIILGFYLFRQLGGSYKTSSQQYKDAKGQIRARHVVRFSS